MYLFVFQAQLNLKLRTPEVTVEEGHPANLLCESENNEQITACYFIYDDTRNKYRIEVNTDNKNIKFYSTDEKTLQHGQCGITIKHVSNANSGNVTCYLELKGFSDDIQGVMHLIVLSEFVLYLKFKG